MTPDIQPTRRWTRVPWVGEQLALWRDPARFVVVPSPRRCGKSDLAKRKIVKEAIRLDPDLGEGAHFLCAAPTHAQAKRLYWNDLKRLIPKIALSSKRNAISESERSITLWNEAIIWVVGMDVPERYEGDSLDGAILDEYANMKPSVWTEHIYPMLGTPGRPPGWAWLIGVPEGRNHYWKLWKRALDPSQSDWSGHRWSAEGIIDPAILAAARNDMDPRSYRQEWEGEFADFAGRAYYDFQTDLHASVALEYDPRLPLIFCFDFNVAPGVCVVVQEQQYLGANIHVGEQVTAVIGEVHIPQNSDTTRVCRKLLQDWGHHKGRVLAYGDASGGARGTSQVYGNDWDLIQQYLCPAFGSRFELHVARHNPPVRSRLNAVNTRAMNVDRIARLLVCPKNAPRTVEDFEGVRILEGSAGDIDKKGTPDLTHLTDAIGYYIEQEFGVFEPAVVVGGGYY